jgi:polyisoprenoid-binding protein YceI
VLNVKPFGGALCQLDRKSCMPKEQTYPGVCLSGSFNINSKRMSKYLFTLLFAAGFAVAIQAGTNPVNGKHKVNTAASKIEWTGRKVTGKHTGTVNIKEGSLEIKDDFLVGGSFTIDMTSIKSTDLTGETAGKLEGHLKSDDFFGTATYPTAVVKITQANAKGDGQFEVKANLTIKDVTQPITFMATVLPEGKKYRATANITIDRTGYNVKYGSGKFFEDLGDTTIYDEFDLAITIVTE